MRKELIVYIKTIEDDEISVASVASNRDFVIINAGGQKLTANVEELKKALESINEFNEVNNVEISPV